MEMHYINVGETYAIDLSSTSDKQVVVGDEKFIDPPVDKSDWVEVALARYRGRRNWGTFVQGALDYGRYLYDDKRPTKPASTNDNYARYAKTGYTWVWGCGTILEKRVQYGKTKSGLYVKVPLFDWSPYDSWWLRTMQDFYENDLLTYSEFNERRDNPPDEILQEVWASAISVKALLNARSVDFLWRFLPERLLRTEIEHHNWEAELDQKYRS